MYVWQNKTRRDRRSRTHAEHEEVLDHDEELQEQLIDSIKVKAEEHKRNVLEAHEVDLATRHIRKIITEYLKTPDGKKEVKAVVDELKKIKVDEKKEMKAHIKEEAKETGGKLKEIKKREETRAIFELFDADGSDSIDIHELKELMKELCLPADEQQVQEMLEQVDTDGSGEIDFDEFYEWYDKEAGNVRKGKGFATGMLQAGKMYRNFQGLTLILEAQRIITSSVEHHKREEALKKFRRYRPKPIDDHNPEDDVNPEDHETAEEKEKREKRFTPVNLVIEPETPDARQYRLRRLTFSPELFMQRGPEPPMLDASLAQPKMHPRISDPDDRRAKQQRRGQAVEGYDAKKGKRAHPRRLMMRSTKTAMAMGWNHTRTVHPTFELVVRELAEAGQSGQIRGGGGGGANSGIGEFTGAIGDTGMGEDFEGQIGIVTPVPGSRASSRGALLVREEASRRSDRSRGGESRGGGSSRGGMSQSQSQGGSRPGTVTFDVDSAASLSGGMLPDGLMVPYDGAQLTPYSPTRSSGRGGEGGGGLVMPNLDKPFSAKLLNQARAETPKTKRIGLSLYGPHNPMRDTVEPSLRDLIPRLLHDDERCPRQFIYYLPPNADKVAVTFEWKGVIMNGVQVLGTFNGNKPEELHSNNETQEFFKTYYLNAGCYHYRFMADGKYKVDERKPAQWEGVERRNCVVVVPCSSEYEFDRSAPPITHVSLPQRQLGDDGVWLLKDCLRNNPFVDTVDVTSAHMSSDGATAFGALLAERPKGPLTSLNCRSNGIGFDGARAIAKGMRAGNTSIASLNLTDNDLGDDGADAIGAGFEGHTSLTALDLGHNLIHDDGAADLARSLLHNRSLLRLGLASNGISVAGASSLSDALRRNMVLCDLDLNRNPLGPAGTKVLAELLKETKTLKRLLMSGSGVMAQGSKLGIHALSEALMVNNSLEVLGLARNGITSWGAREIAVALQKNLTLLSIDLDGNDIDDEWLRPSHTIHTEVDPFIQSITTCILRNGEFAALPNQAQPWDVHGGASEHPHTKRREIKHKESTRFAEVRKDRQDRAARIGGESRGNTNMTGLLGTDPKEGKSRELLLDEERARRARREDKKREDDFAEIAAREKRDAEAHGEEYQKDGRDEGTWLVGADGKTGKGRWQSEAEVRRKAERKAELEAQKREKERIKAEETCVAAAMEKAHADGLIFLDGKAEVDLHGHTGLQQRDHLIEEIIKELKRQEKERHKAHERAKEEMEIFCGKHPEQALNAMEEFEQKHSEDNVRRIFDSFDDDCGGTVDIKELKQLIKDLGLPLNKTEISNLTAALDTDGSGDIDFAEFLDWYNATAHAAKKSHKLGAGMMAATNLLGNMRGVSAASEARRLYMSVTVVQAGVTARTEFRLATPPRFPCSRSTKCFHKAEDLAHHKRKFNFEAELVKQNKFRTRRLMVQQAMERLQAVPDYPRIMVYGEDVPHHIEIQVYDFPNKVTGRPVGIIQHKAVIRCIKPGEEMGWIQMVPTPGMKTVEAWFFNQAEKCKEVMVPMDIGDNPGDDEFAAKVAANEDQEADLKDMEAAAKKAGKKFKVPKEIKQKEKEEKRRKKKQKKRKLNDPPTTNYTFVDPLGKKKLWYRVEDTMPKGAVLKVRERPNADAPVIGGLPANHAIEVTVSSGDWCMVIYTDPETREHNPHKAEVKEGWMLTRTARRLLLVPVEDAGTLEILSRVLEDSESPVKLPEPEEKLTDDEGDSGEDLSPEEAKARRKIKRENDKIRMRKQREQQESDLAEKSASRLAIEEASADVVAHLEDGEELEGRPTTSDMRALMPRPDTAPALTIEDQLALLDERPPTKQSKGKKGLPG